MLLLELMQQNALGCAGGQAGGGGMSSLVLMGAMFLVFYFMLIRPQQKKAREHREMLAALKKGDEVITQGGLFGKITGLTEGVVTLEVSEKVRVRVLRAQILGLANQATQESEAQAREARESKAEK